MKMMMRLQRNQVPSVVKETSGEGVFSKVLHMLAGYQSYDLLMVAGSGGYSGNGKGSSPSKNIAYGGGPGGGGGIFATAQSLAALADEVSWAIAERAADGHDAGNTVRATGGANGGSTVFGEYHAYGGKGGVGGRIDQVGGGIGFAPSKGGDGGTNTLGLVTPGSGGNTGGSYPPPSAPTDGSMYLVASNPAIYSLSGGGGGTGRTLVNDSNENGAQGGANGAEGFISILTHDGGSPVANKGGPGGGINIEVLTGTTEYYGSRKGDASPDGVLVLRFL